MDIDQQTQDILAPFPTPLAACLRIEQDCVDFPLEN